MSRNMTQKLIGSHLVSGEMVPGEEISLLNDYCIDSISKWNYTYHRERY